MRIAVLGPVRVVRDGAELDLGPHKQRTLLAALALSPDRVVPTDTIVDLLWGDAPPAAVAASLHGYVAGLRRLLEPARAARAEPSVLVTVGRGYALRVHPEAVDAVRFAAAVEDAHRRLGGHPLDVDTSLGTTELDDLADALAAALDLWRGLPYPELEGTPAGDAERLRLAELRLTAVLDRARIRVRRGEAAAVSTTLAPFASEHPLREDVWALLALALARAGRQADALQALATVRTALADELGVDPGPTLRDLELRILRHDSAVVGAAPPPQRPAQPTPPPVPAGGRAVSASPFVGRTREVDALEQLLACANDGVPRFAVVLGEPGIGKSRLTARLADTAVERGFAVLVGRCSSDEGAPPLWPWRDVLHELAEAVPDVAVPDLEELLAHADGAPLDRFRLFDAVVGAATAAAGRRPVLLLVDDLHWADASTLRLLQQLVERGAGALAVVVTRRSHPEPAGPLRELGEALARRDALRVEPAGLTAGDVAALAEAMGTMPGHSVAHAVVDRTGGNPFFVVEVLRLLGSERDVPEPEVPAAVGDVIAARVAQLPERTRRLLEAAAAVGRSIDVDLVARLEDADPDDVLDGLEPALAAGIVVVDEAGALRFGHALVRDAVEAAAGPLRRQRRHARLAEILADDDPSSRRLTEIAGHWLRAGPRHAGRAWRTALEAARYAVDLSAHEEAADLLRRARAGQELDRDATVEERYELLIALADACRASADSEGQREAAARARELAEDADDVRRLAVAAVASSEGALWSNRPEGEVDDATLHALHRALDALPGGDSPLRCRVYVALARELFWAPGGQEAEACAELGLAMARRLGDPGLVALACRTMYVNMFRPDTLDARRALADEAVRGARESGDAEAEALGMLWVAISAGESGEVARREEAAQEARRLAARLRLRYLQVMLGATEVSWLALQGRFAEADRLMDDVRRWAAYASFPFRDESLLAAHACLELWRGNAARLVDAASSLDERSPTDMGTFLVLLLLRTGRDEQAAELVDLRPFPVTDDYFAASLDLAIAAEAALVLGRPDLAAQVYPLLAQWPGRVVVAGTGSPLGPVDAFLALAAAATGETALAGRHAEEALRLCHEWRMDPVADWLTGLRSRHRF